MIWYMILHMIWYMIEVTVFEWELNEWVSESHFFPMAREVIVSFFWSNEVVNSGSYLEMLVLIILRVFRIPDDIPGICKQIIITKLWYLQVDKDGNGSISLSEYFEIFKKHGIQVNRAETDRWARKTHIRYQILHRYFSLDEGCWFVLINKH